MISRPIATQSRSSFIGGLSDIHSQMARRPEPNQKVDRFDRFAEAISQFVSRGSFFAASLIVVLIWIPTIFLIPSIDTWQLVINTLTSVLAFLLIALLQNSERRYDDALHRKIDAIAAGLADVMERVGELDGKDKDGELREKVESLGESIELERRM
jgi:low affinity Fe/Cu permease